MTKGIHFSKQSAIEREREREREKGRKRTLGYCSPQPDPLTHQANVTNAQLDPKCNTEPVGRPDDVHPVFPCHVVALAIVSSHHADQPLEEKVEETSQGTEEHVHRRHEDWVMKIPIHKKNFQQGKTNV